MCLVSVCVGGTVVAALDLVRSAACLKSPLANPADRRHHRLCSLTAPTALVREVVNRSKNSPAPRRPRPTPPSIGNLFPQMAGREQQCAVAEFCVGTVTVWLADRWRYLPLCHSPNDTVLQVTTFLSGEDKSSASCEVPIKHCLHSRLN